MKGLGKWRNVCRNSEPGELVLLTWDGNDRLKRGDYRIGKVVGTLLEHCNEKELAQRVSVAVTARKSDTGEVSCRDCTSRYLLHRLEKRFPVDTLYGVRWDWLRTPDNSLGDATHGNVYCVRVNVY